MDVRQLIPAQLDELKQAYLTEKSESVSYGELCDAQKIPNEIIFEHFQGIVFSKDDFFS